MSMEREEMNDPSWMKKFSMWERLKLAVKVAWKVFRGFRCPDPSELRVRARGVAIIDSIAPLTDGSGFPCDWHRTNAFSEESARAYGSQPCANSAVFCVSATDLVVQLELEKHVHLCRPHAEARLKEAAKIRKEEFCQAKMPLAAVRGFI